MNEFNEYLEWHGLNVYTNDFKEWIFKLFRKVHARIGHVEEELYKLKEQNKSSYSIKKKVLTDGLEYVLVDDYTKKEHGSININSNGFILSTWEEDLNI